MKKITSLFVAVLVVLPLLGAMAGTKAPVAGTINLNSASVEQLQTLPGIGKAKAGAIVAYRESHPFKAVDELVEVKGIGTKMIERLREHLAVTDAAVPQEAKK